MPKAPETERRLHRRYWIRLPIQYRLHGSSPRKPNSVGKSLNISRGGVLFQTNEKKLSVGQSMKILIDWPVRLEGECQLKLVMWGRIVRRDGRLVAVSVVRREFQTTKK